jgi:hypothetical protein
VGISGRKTKGNTRDKNRKERSSGRRGERDKSWIRRDKKKRKIENKEKRDGNKSWRGKMGKERNNN